VSQEEGKAKRRGSWARSEGKKGGKRWKLSNKKGRVLGGQGGRPGQHVKRNNADKKTASCFHLVEEGGG